MLLSIELECSVSYHTRLTTQPAISWHFRWIQHYRVQSQSDHFRHKATYWFQHRNKFLQTTHDIFKRFKSIKRSCTNNNEAGGTSRGRQYRRGLVLSRYHMESFDQGLSPWAYCVLLIYPPNRHELGRDRMEDVVTTHDSSWVVIICYWRG